jgi:outer membrane protein assembly factor BamD (BamD/ComL family)
MGAYLTAALVACGLYYYATHVFQFDDLLAKAKSNPSASWAPTVDYYAGLVYLQRADYGKCQVAFTQLLTDAATSQYAEKGLVHQEDCAEYNHDWDTAKAAVETYQVQFPKGKDADIMAKRLEMLKYQHP